MANPNGCLYKVIEAMDAEFYAAEEIYETEAGVGLGFPSGLGVEA